MSWSIGLVGRKEAVALKLKEELEKNLCNDPEEDIRKTIVLACIDSVGALPAGTVCRVEAHGSMTFGQGMGNGLNNIHLKVEPIYGFIG